MMVLMVEIARCRAWDIAKVTKFVTRLTDTVKMAVKKVTTVVNVIKVSNSMNKKVGEFRT